MAKRKSKGRVKRAFASFLGFVMVVGITIAGTLAFMNAVSNERKNTFTGTNDIKLYLDEPNYNIGADGTVKWEDQLDPREYIPGETYPKDPTLYNSTGLQYLKQDSTIVEYAEEWVAMRVDYSVYDKATSKDVAVTHEQLYTDDKTKGCFTEKAGLIKGLEFDIDTTKKNTDGTTETITGNWMKIEPTMYEGEAAIDYTTNSKYEIYVYKYKLEAANQTTDDLKNMDADDFKTFDENISPSEKINLSIKTSPLFEEIQLKTQEQLKTNGYDIADLTQFNINLKGGAIKDMETITVDEIVDPSTITGNSDTDIANKQSCQKVINSLVELLADKKTN